MDDLKALTLESDRPLLQSTQFNRAAGKGGAEGSLETIGYTDAIGTHSSQVVAAKMGPTDNPRMSRLLQFLKGREGETGSVAINFRFAPTNLEEMDWEEGEESSTQEAPTGGAAAASVEWMA